MEWEKLIISKEGMKVEIKSQKWQEKEIQSKDNRNKYTYIFNHNKHNWTIKDKDSQAELKMVS